MISRRGECSNWAGTMNLYGSSASQNIGFNHGSGSIRVSGKHDCGVNKIDATRALIKAYGIDRRETKRQLNVDHDYSNAKKTKTWLHAEDEEFDWQHVIKPKPAPVSGLIYPFPSGQVFQPPPISSRMHGHKIPPNQQFQPLMQPPHQAIVVPPPSNNNNNNKDPSSTGSTSISGLLCSLMAQGVISLKNQAPPIADSVPLDFNPDSLKVRHEFVISALYTDLPSQCKTCGRRFKCREEHGKHMDWHLNSNRRRLSLKNRKEIRSRDWYVTDTLWIASSTNVAPQFSEQKKNSVEDNNNSNHKDDTTAVPADYNQRACTLCGENFEDFYSEETEDWMYKGATYMNSRKFGSIVHAKCMSD